VALGVALGIAAFGLLGGIVLAATGAWAALGRWLGGRLDRRNFGHAVGLVGLVTFCFLAVAPLLALGGEAPLLRAVADDPDALADERGDWGELLDIYYELAWTVPLAYMLVGVPALRGLRAGLARLGVGPLRRRHVPLTLGLTAVLLLVGTAVDETTVIVWEALDWPTTDPELVGELFGAALTPTGAVASAIAAGLGEELLVRGALQPRFGWLLPNLAFTASHAYQYGPDALVSVFVLGAILAGIRARWGTSLSIVVHILYDLVLFLIPALEWPGF
ncbi:MAG: CPBP family intramembrane metalloprotease, partial [Chloroflexota bacterium]|nr:CPBP family intramembrane metalloprotease [Chloroflexota bacterium]